MDWRRGAQPDFVQGCCQGQRVGEEVGQEAAAGSVGVVPPSRLRVGGGLVLCNFVLGEVWRQRDGRDVTSEYIIRDMRSPRARP